MEVILRQTIDTLGRAGQVVKVSPGYARNFLLPRKMAYTVTPGNMKVIEAERQNLLRKEAVQKNDAEKLKELLDKVELVVRPIWMWLKNSRRRATPSRNAESTWMTTSRLSANTKSPSVFSRTLQLTSN